MIKYPIGIQTFSNIREEQYMYVDKTQYVYELANTKKYVFLSRPRRFGKSLLTSTFHAYFSGQKELFHGLAVEHLEKEWKKYPVLHFSLSTAKRGTVDDLDSVIAMQLKWAEQQYGIENDSSNVTARLSSLVMRLYEKLHQSVVILIDEYDAPLLTVLHNKERLEAIRTELQSFYSPLKDLDPYLRFVFITGISKFSQLSIFSQLNNLYNISMLPKYAALCGITQQELEDNFKAGISGLAQNLNTSKDDVLKKLKRQYDGYHFAAQSPGVYNPFSLLYAMDTEQIGNYWFATGTPIFLVNMIKKFHTDITTIDGSKAEAEDFDAPTEDMHSILPLFYQSGYITIKNYDPRSQRYTLGFPNEEVKVGMMRCLLPYFVSPDSVQASNACWNISEGLLDGDVDKALTAARAFFASIPYQSDTLKDAPTSEGHFTAMLYVMFSFLNRYVYTQVRTAKGRMDILLKTDTAIYVMELKIDGSVDEALRQIDDKGYTIPYEIDERKVVKVGINFSTKERTITEWKTETNNAQ